MNKHENCQDQVFTAEEREWARPIDKIWRELVDLGFDSKPDLLIS